MGRMQFHTRRWSKTFLIAGALAVGAFFSQAKAAPVIVLADNNSVAAVDVGTQAGMFSWQVQGQNQLIQQWFWFRIGNNPEQSIDTLGAPVVVTPNARTLSTTYAGSGLGVRIDYTLSGGAVVPSGTAVSDIAETITITNNTAAAIPLHFFQYSNFDIGGPGGDTVQLGKNLAGLFNEAVQSDPLAGLEETVNTPGASHGEANFVPVTLNKLNDGVATTLNDNAGPVGPGDTTWALQWDDMDQLAPGDQSLAPGASYIISKDKRLNVIVPEPTSAAIFAIGLTGLIARKRH